MNASEFLDKKHASIVNALQKPFRNPEDIGVLKYLIGVLGDLKPYTQNFTEV